MTVERLKGVAMRKTASDGASLLVHMEKGSHDQLLRRAAEQGVPLDTAYQKGFISSEGRFLTRRSAAHVGVDSGQVPDYFVSPQGVRALLSSDVSWDSTKEKTT